MARAIKHHSRNIASITNPLTQMISLAVVIPIGQKKATDSKLETQIQSELRITNYEFSIISCCNLLKVAHT